jgi:formylglycine-generating enzyme
VRVNRKWALAAISGALCAGGCRQIAGLPDAVVLGSGGAGGESSAGGAGGAGGATGTLGQPCSPPGELACNGHAQKLKLLCDSDETWHTNGTCNGAERCVSTPGPDQGTCAALAPLCAGSQPGDRVCDGLDRVQCGPDLVSTTLVEACQFVCAPSACAECMAGQPGCSGLQPQRCDATGTWHDLGPSCGAAAWCSGGACVTPTSCLASGDGLSNCGPSSDESCCASLAVKGGQYSRGNEPGAPATVSDFRLDRFEITVGRFREFAAAVAGGWLPEAGSGKHAHLSGGAGLNGGTEPGWIPTWNSTLTGMNPVCKAPYQVYQTWTPSAGPSERLPINCIDWHQAYAFCIWDGGFLPSEAEWNYAAAGGALQRVYPWGSEPPDATYAVYGCTADGSAAQNCAFEDIRPVGSRSPKGDGFFGQADLAGDVWEWTLDQFKDVYPAPCADCAYSQGLSFQVIRGGGWFYDESSLLTSQRIANGSDIQDRVLGARCARAP